MGLGGAGQAWRTLSRVGQRGPTGQEGGRLESGILKQGLAVWI